MAIVSWQLMMMVVCEAYMLPASPLSGRPAISRRLHDPRSSESKDPLSLAALKAEVARRDASSDGQHLLCKSHALEKLGPHPTTSPKQVVEHVLHSLSFSQNISQAFAFTCVPLAKRGTHKSSTDWSRRMAWDKCAVVRGEPSGHFYDHEKFASMVRAQYAPLLELEGYHFIGDSSSWQHGSARRVKMTGPKQYVVEARTRANEHLVITFKLLYDWVRTRTLRQPAQLSGCSSSCDCDQALTYPSVFPPRPQLVYCHLVAEVTITSIQNDAYGLGPGTAEDASMGI